MKKFLSFLLVGAGFLPLYSCVYQEDVTPYYIDKYSEPISYANIKYVPLDDLLNHIKPQEIKYVFDKIVISMCPCICKYNKVIVTDLPNLSYLKVDKLSSYFGDTLRTSVSDMCHKPTILAEFSKYLKINTLGIKVRSRKVNDLLNKKYKGYSVAFLTGTYQINNDKITVFVKFIDAKTGKILCAKEGIINIYP